MAVTIGQWCHVEEMLYEVFYNRENQEKNRQLGNAMLRNFSTTKSSISRYLVAFASVKYVLFFLVTFSSRSSYGLGGEGRGGGGGTISRNCT